MKKQMPYRYNAHLKFTFLETIREIARNEPHDIVSAYEETIDEYNKKHPHIDWNEFFENLTIE